MKNTRKNVKGDKRPTFVLLVAISIDGKITKGSKEGSEWTSKEDRTIFQRELYKCDATIMGRKTFEAIKRPLTPRNRIVFSHKKTFSHSAECENVFRGGAKELFALLDGKKWRRVAILGGTSIYDWFLKQNLVDEIYLTVEPVVFGAGKPFTASNHSIEQRFRLVSSKKLNEEGTILLHYKIRS